MAEGAKGTNSDVYILDVGKSGADRLRLLDQVYGASTRRMLLQAGLGQGSRVLDLACGTILTDGAKRDRWIWPGDLGISGLTAYVSTGDTLSVTNDLNTLFAHQNSAGALPCAGPPGDLGEVPDSTAKSVSISTMSPYSTFPFWAKGPSRNVR